ncbi:MAG: hypothetical protein ACYCX2_10450 [Christensenellales bacterium]
MNSERIKIPVSLYDRFPPSEPCGCDVCRSFCKRPGWWSVEEAVSAIKAGYGGRMMLEIAPDFTFGVLSPAFFGCEGRLAYQEYAGLGCNFLVNGLCQLHGTTYQPIECRFCHHTRIGQGPICHEVIEKDWNTIRGQTLVLSWAYEHDI